MAFTAEDDIRVHAYHLWEANGRPSGRDLEFWTLAQQCLAGGMPSRPRAARRAAGGKAEPAVKQAARANRRQPARQREPAS
jgi:hypothetical protein